MRRTESRIKTLVLTLVYPHKASYYDDWLEAFHTHPAFASETFDILRGTPTKLAQRIEECAAVVLLHSCTADTVEPLTPLAPVLAERRHAKLLAFVGNEYNSPFAPLSEKIATLRACKPDLVATQLPLSAGEYLYVETGAHVISLPHALNPAVFRPGPPHEKRRVDIGVRSFRYPPWLGDDDRNRLIEYFVNNGRSLGLSLDISQDTRFNRDEWARFLADSRGTISTEAGSWYLDRDDKLAQRVHAHLAKSRKGLVIKNKSPLRRLARRLPMLVKEMLTRVLKKGPVKFEAFEENTLDFDEIHELFFKIADKADFYSKSISSRHLDAVGSKTCQIMFPGRFNDVLAPNEHYIPLEPDFSNIDEVIWRFRDAAERQRIVDTAYQHVMSAHTYGHRLEQVARSLAQAPSPHDQVRSSDGTSH